jgi:hypothetical protein
VSGSLGCSVELITFILSGVIGLTTAIKIQETSGYKVTIVAEIFPTDTKNVRYASHFAVRMNGIFTVGCGLICSLQGAQFVASASRHDLRQRRA